MKPDAEPNESLPTEPDPKLVEWYDDVDADFPWWCKLLMAACLLTAFGCVIWAVAS